MRASAALPVIRQTAKPFTKAFPAIRQADALESPVEQPRVITLPKTHCWQAFGPRCVSSGGLFPVLTGAPVPLLMNDGRQGGLEAAFFS